jgi:hypothetical protein
VTTPDRKHLWQSALRQTGRDPAWVGFWLRRHRDSERLRPLPLARKLGIALEGLALLSLCRTPRADRFAEDLAVICRRTGADASVLAQILRQEQALARWTEQAPAREGWLLAASDRPGEDPAAHEPTPPAKDAPEEPSAGGPHAR